MGASGSWWLDRPRPDIQAQGRLAYVAYRHSGRLHVESVFHPSTVLAGVREHSQAHLCIPGRCSVRCSRSYAVSPSQKEASTDGTRRWCLPRYRGWRMLQRRSGHIVRAKPGRKHDSNGSPFSMSRHGIVPPGDRVPGRRPRRTEVRNRVILTLDVLLREAVFGLLLWSGAAGRKPDCGCLSTCSAWSLS